MSRLDDREKRTIYRRLAKEQYDNLITLSADNSRLRLLDEGAIVYADGSLDCYIEKGTLQKYVDSLPENFKGYINLGHMPFSSVPFYLGEWTKEDLSLEDIGDGRKALYVSPVIYRDSVFVRELAKRDYSVGISAEFYYTGEYKADPVDTAGHTQNTLCINGVNIDEFAIVGECGNVNSSGIHLKGGEELKSLKELFAKLEAEVAEEEEIEVSEDEIEEEIDEEAEEIEEETEKSEETEEETEETGDMTEVLETLEKLTAENESLKADKDKLSEEVAGLKAEIDEFIGNFKELTVKLNPNLGKAEKKEEVEVKSRYKGNDGIGEL